MAERISDLTPLSAAADRKGRMENAARPGAGFAAFLAVWESVADDTLKNWLSHARARQEGRNQGIGGLSVFPSLVKTRFFLLFLLTQRRAHLPVPQSAASTPPPRQT